MAGINTLLVLVVLFHTSWQISTPQDDSYVAAVVEFEVGTDSDTNLQNYIQLIQQAAESNADLVVFPEMTLTRGTSVTVPINGLLKENPIPALSPSLFDEPLVALSSAARNNQIYVVVNVQELMDCTTESSAPGEKCPEAKEYRFNTNIVFDRNGSVIDRYRKIHLFGEFSRYPALEPDLGIFETDFGVTFGHFICFDLMFQVPAVQIVEKLNLTDIIFTTMWFSEMPYLSASQIQESYAYVMNVNMLASGANNVRIGSAGSGIYSGKAGALISVMPGVPTTRLLVHRVPKVPGQISDSYPGHIPDDPRNLDDLHLITDPSLPSHTSRLLSAGTNDFVLTDKEVRCHFHVKLNERSSEGYRYRAAVFSGVRSFSGVATGGNRICAIISCTADDIQTCGSRFLEYAENRTAIFEEAVITATVPTPVVDPQLSASDSIFFPVTLDETILPLKVQDFIYSQEMANETSILTLTLNRELDLYTFAIWGRVFETDGEEANPPLSGVAGQSVLNIFLLTIAFSFLLYL